MYNYHYFIVDLEFIYPNNVSSPYSISSIDICKKVTNQTYKSFKKKKVEEEVEKVEDVSSEESDVDAYTELLSTMKTDHSSEGSNS